MKLLASVAAFLGALVATTTTAGCVIVFIDEPEIIIKDDGALFDPDMKDERVHYHVLLACNSCTIRLGGRLIP